MKKKGKRKYRKKLIRKDIKDFFMFLTRRSKNKIDRYLDNIALISTMDSFRENLKRLKNEK